MFFQELEKQKFRFAGRSLLIGCVFLFVFGVVPSHAYAAHPQIWLSDSAVMSRLTTAATANSTEWQRLKSFCDTRTITDWDYQGQEAYRYLANFALCYRVTYAVSGAGAAAPYGAKALAALTTVIPNDNNQSILTFSSYSTDSGYGIRNYVPALALAYDWLYDYSGLTAGNKSAIASRINAWLTWYAANGYCASDNSNCSPAIISNYHSGYMLASVFGSIALDGEYSSSAPIAAGEALFTDAVNLFDTRMSGGHWPEGWNYGAGVYQRYLMAGSALKLYTGTAAYMDHAWLSDNVLFRLNALTPDGQFFYDDGAWTGDAKGVPTADDMMAAGYAYGWASSNGRFARSYLDIAGLPGTTGLEWTTFLFYDPLGTAADLSGVTRSHLASGFGLATMRSDWQSSTGTWASLVSGPYLSAQGAQEPDAGHIALYRGTTLLMNAGTDLYNPANLLDTSSKNTFTLENRVGTTYYGQTAFFYGDCPNPNGNDPIGIIRHNDADSYVFTAGEFSAAYQKQDPDTGNCGGPTGVDWLQRNLLYVRPDVIVMYDQVKKQADQSTMVPTMHFHFPTSPTQVSGNRQLSVDSGASRLQLSTVLPAATSSLLNYDAINATNGPGMANYHLKVAYSAQQSYQNFLTVLRSTSTTVAFPTTTAISGTNAYGTEISGAGITGSIVAVFADNSNLTTPASLQYQYPTAADVTQYVMLLKSNTSYGVTTSSVGGDTLVSLLEGGATNPSVTDSAGVLVISAVPSSDTTAPTITSISSDTAAGSYNAGDTIDIDVTFSEAVTSSGNVTVTLETGTTDRTCTFTVSNSSTGTCNYTVQAGDTSSDLTTNSISGTIADQSSNAMSVFTPTTNLAANEALVIDTSASAPVILYTDITSGPLTGGENNKGVWLSVFGKNFGSDSSLVSVSVGGASTQTFKVFGTSHGRTDIQQVTIQLGDLSGATLSNGTAYTVGVTVSGTTASNPNSLTFTPLAGDIYFLATSGCIDTTDTSTGGTFASPFCTMQKPGFGLTFSIQSADVSGAYGRVRAGDFIIMRGGTYTTAASNNYFMMALNKSGCPIGTNCSQGGGSSSGPITVMGYPGETAYVDNSYTSGSHYYGAFSASDSAREANGYGAYWTFSNLKIESGRDDGPFNSAPKSPGVSPWDGGARRLLRPS